MPVSAREMEMNASAVSAAVRHAEPIDERAGLEDSRRIWTACLFGSSFLALFCGSVGVLISFEVLVGVSGQLITRVGTILIAASFPLLFAAAHSLDKIGEADKKIKLINCRRQGFNG